MKSHTKLARDLLKLLDQWGAYVYHEAITSTSIYIKFPHWGLGSIRIGDHRGRMKYRYRWMLRTDGPPDTWSWDEDRGVRRLTFGVNEIRRFVREFEIQAADRGIKPGDKETWEEFQKRKEGIGVS